MIWVNITGFIAITLGSLLGYMWIEKRRFGCKPTDSCLYSRYVGKYYANFPDTFDQIILYNQNLITYFYKGTYLLFGPAFLASFISTLPMWAVVWVILFSRHPAEKAIVRTVGQTRPDYLIERELWQIMQRQDMTDERVERTFGQLSRSRQQLLQVEYDRRLAEARRLREMVEAKTKVLNEEDRLGQSVHELERIRRAREDR